MGFITTDIEIPIYTKTDMVRYKASDLTLREYTRWEKKPLKKKVSMQGILKVCCYVANTTPQKVHSRSRKAEDVFGRQTAQYFSHILIGDSLGRIGKAIGKRDHATVIHSIRTIRTAADPQWHDNRKEKIMLIARLLEDKYRAGVYELIKFDREKAKHDEKMQALFGKRFHS